MGEQSALSTATAKGSPQKSMSQGETEDIVSLRRDVDEIVDVGKANTGTLSNANACSGVVKAQPQLCDHDEQYDEINRCTANIVSSLHISGTIPNQEPLQVLQKVGSSDTSTGRREDTGDTLAGCELIPGAMSREPSNSQPEKNLNAHLNGPKATPMTLKSILSSQHRYSLDSSGAKLMTKSRSILPDYNQLRNKDLQSRYRRKSVSFKSKGNDMNGHSATQTQQRSMSARTLYDSRPTNIFTRNSRLRPKATWLDVTGTPEAWIKPNRLQECVHLVNDNQLPEE